MSCMPPGNSLALLEFERKNEFFKAAIKWFTTRSADAIRCGGENPPSCSSGSSDRASLQPGFMLCAIRAMAKGVPIEIVLLNQNHNSWFEFYDSGGLVAKRGGRRANNLKNQSNRKKNM